MNNFMDTKYDVIPSWNSPGRRAQPHPGHDEPDREIQKPFPPKREEDPDKKKKKKGDYEITF